MTIKNSEYQSPNTVGKRQTIPIDVNDPRLRWDKIGQTLARSGAEVLQVNQNATNLLASGLNAAAGVVTLQGQITGSALTYDNVAGSIGLGIFSSGEFAPSPVSNAHAAYLGEDIVLTFDFDTTDTNNKWINQFYIDIYDPSTSKWLSIAQVFDATSLNKTSSSQTITLTFEILASTGIANTTNITNVRIATSDAVLHKSVYVETGAPNPAYASMFDTPNITLSHGTDWYSVKVNNLDAQISKGLFGIIVEENVTTEANVNNIDSSKWVQASQSTLVSPIVIYAPDDAHRWVRVKFISKSGGPSSYSVPQDVTPDTFIKSNTTPPDNVTSASAIFSGDDVVVTFALPSSNAGASLKVTLNAIVNGSASSFYAYFYHNLIQGETSFTIKSADIYAQFGNYYSSYQGTVQSVSLVGVESTSTANIATFTRTSTISSVTPALGTPNINNSDGVFTVVAIQNGYSVSWSNPNTFSYAEIYESKIPWAAYPTDDSAIVYQGNSPAVIQTTDASPRYILIHYYDKYDVSSQFNTITAAGQIGGAKVTPIDSATLSLINNPIKISTDGSIFTGAGDLNTYPQLYLNKDGLFAKDANGNATTYIVNSAINGASTFITTRAKIADWTITDAAIESTLTTGITKYTGLSASNVSYAFWAGSGTSQNTDNTAQFSVTPLGRVNAKNIYITGNGTTQDLINVNNLFKVDNLGAVTASSATISGVLHVKESSTFDGNIFVGNAGIITAGVSQTAGSSVQIAYQGLVAYNGDHSATTKIYSTPAGSTAGGSSSSVSLWSSTALFGTDLAHGWLIQNNKLNSTYISLDSAADTITITSNANNAYGIKLSAKADTDHAIQSGYFAAPDFYVNHDGSMTAQNATIKGVVTAKTGYIGYVSDTSPGWTIDTGQIKAVSGSSSIVLDAPLNRLQSYGNSSLAPGSVVSYSADSVGGPIGQTSGTAQGSSTNTYYSAGYIASDNYLVMSTAKAFQIFGGNQSKGDVPLLSVDPTGSSTNWYNNGVKQAVGKSFAAISTGVIYLDSNDIIIGNGSDTGSGSSGNIYFNGNLNIRNSTDVLGSHGYIRNIYIGTSAPAVGSTGTGFVGDLYVTY